MKKIGLLFVLAALAFNVKAVDFPSTWEIVKSVWSEYRVAPPGFNRQTAEAIDYGEEYIDLYSMDFLDEWYRIPDEYAYPMKNQVIMGTNTPSKTPASDGTGLFKVAFDDEGIVVLCYFIDDEVPTGSEKWEIAYSPYQKLGTGGRNFTVSSEDRSSILYTRYWELGASKITMMSSGVDGIMQITGSDGMAKDVSSAQVGKFTVDFRSFTQYTTPKEIMWAAKIPYYALDQEVIEDLLGNIIPGYGVQFTKDMWPAACDGQGLSFDVKFRDVDTDMPSPANQSRDYWWNADVNDGFYSNDWAGFLKQGPKIGVVNAGDIPSNIKVTASQIELAQAADVQIFTASGMLVKSVANETIVPTTDLQPGVYIVTSGNETAKFVK